MASIFINGRFLTQTVTGVQRYAFEISSRLVGLNDDIIFLVPRITKFSSHNSTNWKIRRVGFGRGYFWEQIVLPVFLFFNGSPLLVSLCNLSPVFYRNKITVVHDLAVIDHPEWFNWKFVLFYRFALKRILYSSKLIITDSHFSKQRIQAVYKIQSNKIEVIYLSVSKNLVYSTNLKHLNDNFLKKYNNKFILCVASIDPRKNFKNVIKAFISLNYPNVDLVIVGKKSKVFNDINFSNVDNKHIRFEGYLNDIELAWLYKHASFFTYLSLYEGFGLPPLEAMCSGCPVLLSNIPVHKELYEGAALFVDPLSINEISLGMKDLLTNDTKRESLINKGYSTSSEFDWDKSAKKFLEFVKQYYE